MRFTRYTATLLFVLTIGGAVITATVYFHALPFADSSLIVQTAFAIILGLPLLMGCIGFIIVFSGRHSFHFAPHNYGTTVLVPPSDRSQKDDPLIHLAIGMLVALLQDFSHGRIINYDLYASQLRSMLEQELSYFRVYFDRGYTFHFNFYHQEPYEAFVQRQLSEADVVVEVRGLFDYYFERGGHRHPTPHGYDQNPPLIHIPARMRLRVQKNAQSGQWQMAGFSDSIRGLQLGIAIE